FVGGGGGKATGRGKPRRMACPPCASERTNRMVGTARRAPLPTLRHVQIGSDPREHAAKHLGGQHAGVRIVARAVIAVVQPEYACLMRRAVGERCRYGAKPECLDERIV